MANTTKKVTDEKSMTLGNKTYHTGELAARQNDNNMEVRELERDRIKLHAVYKGQKKVDVVGAPMYQAYFGKQMCICINTIPIYVPLDGRHYKIPEAYAEVFNSRITAINEDMELEKRRRNVKDNVESYPGELDLVTPV